jgi:nucleotide-binding universal stress UspA family protein
MKEFNSIAVGIDYSPASASALREASRIANWNDATLTCFHIFDEEIVEKFRSQDDFDEGAVSAEALEHLEKFVANEVGAGHSIDCEIAIGHPFKSVLSTVSACKADLAVLGTRGRTGLQGFFAGTTAEKIIYKSPCSALVVKPKGFEFKLKD